MPNLIKITISKNTTPISKKSFSTPCTFVSDVPLDDTFEKGTSRAYSSLTGLSADFDTDSDTYKAIAKLMGQIRKLDSFRIFRRNDPVQKVKTITYTGTFASGQSFAGTVNGKALTTTNFTTDAAGTLGAIATKIAQIEGVASATVSSQVITVTATSEWDLSLTSFTGAGTTPPTATIATTTAGHTLADDFNDAIAEKKNWFWMLETSHNKGAILSVQSLLSPAGKMGMFLSSEEGITQSVTTDLASKINTAKYDNSIVAYHHDLAEFFDHAWSGNCLPIAPGKDRWGERELSGVTPSPLSETAYDNIVGKQANCYVEYGQYNLTFLGRVASGDYIDNVRNLYYMANELNTDLLAYIVGTLKIPFTSAGQLGPISKAKAVMVRMIQEGILAEFVEDAEGNIKPGFEITFPKISEISPTDKSNRKFGGIKISGTLAGGIESLEFEIYIEV